MDERKGGRTDREKEERKLEKLAGWIKERKKGRNGGKIRLREK